LQTAQLQSRCQRSQAIKYGSLERVVTYAMLQIINDNDRFKPTGN
jgi:hypothetical protein